jgi:RimJ/RimL family protein N-acetyltransferase
VGSCAFKGQPVDGKVEIAYCTFPAHEGRGVATAACKALVGIAQSADAGVTITARTLPEENASASVLKKNNFMLAGTAIDPEDGEVFEWVYQ